MKTVTMQFKETAVDGLPEESGSYVVITKSAHLMMILEYSKTTKRFNGSIKTAIESEYWTELPDIVIKV